ncbi:ATP-binding protein [Convivina praedatoris]|uniref:AAA+ ATPase domain-containing protein n=1 Tax=Convivina praedatoris TaxID=2880963 RepID=A0ABN8H8C7_9LACO|nr:ATP-binding protein [Convivina sp. LMG 32447]CAH1852153.1 hypothetical protein LMG032447_00507 [Convivina sp. LMG 32447]CAH1852184.1 hypothetical protein R078138_00517 [Convivina sp. LMG 32447]CAH1852761.1 hypothetical protein R077815_00600 [Convivina sp. LMG 32447]
MNLPSNNVKIYLGKSADGQPVSASYADLLAQHLLVVGQTGSGKSTSLKQIISQLQEHDLTNIIFDPTGEYSQDLPNCITYTIGQDAFVDLANQDARRLLALWDLDWPDFLVEKLQSAIVSLRIQNMNYPNQAKTLTKLNLKISQYQTWQRKLALFGHDYPLHLLAEQLIQEFVVPLANEQADYSYLGQELDHRAIRHYWPQILALQELLGNPLCSRIFHLRQPNGQIIQYDLSFILSKFENTLNQKRSLVLNLSNLQSYPHIQQNVISLLMDQILYQRINSSCRRPVAIVIDEAHRYLPVNQPLAQSGIFDLLREGRKFGLSLLMSTQSSLDIPAQLRGEFHTWLVHNLQTKEEVEHLPSSTNLGQLKVGQAVLFRQNKQSQIINIQQFNR